MAKRPCLAMIYLVQGELISSIVSIYEHKDEKQKDRKLLTNEKAKQDAVADAWIDYIYRFDT